jgi:ABC-type phosphate transport system substrate-binding protein
MWLARALLFHAFLCVTAAAYAQEVVRNPDVPQQELALSTVRAIFGMRLRTWSDGTPIHVFVLPDEDPLHAAFAKRVLQVFPNQLRSAWDRLVYSGTGQAPAQVDSQEEMRAKVATTPGAVGYLTEGITDDSVRVLHVR